ncbi:MAG: hypothetical protein AB7O24_30595 [Kofleriaceae bacterium]
MGRTIARAVGGVVLLNAAVIVGLYLLSDTRQRVMCSIESEPAGLHVYAGSSLEHGTTKLGVTPFELDRNALPASWRASLEDGLLIDVAVADVSTAGHCRLVVRWR